MKSLPVTCERNSVHGFDCEAGRAGCNRSLAEATMAGVRLNVPRIFSYGRVVLRGRVEGREPMPCMSEAIGSVVWKYAQQTGPARAGAATHPGAKEEVISYADQ